MSLPVIATNWSGPTGYLNERNGYPLKYSEVIASSEVITAEPDLSELKRLMRRVYTERDDSLKKASRAREDVVKALNPGHVVGIMMERVRVLLDRKSREEAGGKKEL